MTPIVVREGNTIEIPPELVKRLGLIPGTQVYVYQVGETLSVRPQPSHLLAACEGFERAMEEAGVTLDDLLVGVAAERESLAREHDKGGTPSAAISSLP